MSFVGFNGFVARVALIKELTEIQRHYYLLHMATVRTLQVTFKFHCQLFLSDPNVTISEIVSSRFRGMTQARAFNKEDGLTLPPLPFGSRPKARSNGGVKTESRGHLISALLYRG